MNVRELTQDQLSELKSDYFYNHLDDYNMIGDCCFYWELSDELIFDYYDGIDFVSDDFGCSAGEYEPTADYDSLEDINKCLNCQKIECDNCLKSINGV